MNVMGGSMKINKDSFLLFAALALSGVLIVCSSEAKEGALYGAALAQRVIIPSLLPLLILFNFVQHSAAGRALETMLSPITCKVLRLPKCAGPAVFLGLIGGYPTGALLTANLYRNSDIDCACAKRLLRFAFSGGAGFIITALGTGILKSREQGVILFTSVTAAAMISALLGGFLWGKAEEGESSYLSLPVADALNKSVEQSARSVINMAAYIVLFCAVQGNIQIPALLAPLIEITSGTAQCATEMPLYATAFYLAFGGFCIHLQLFTIIKEAGMRYADFLLWRGINGVISSAVCAAILQIFPEDSAVFSNYSQTIVRPTSVNAALSILMLLGCAVLILDLENRKRKC